MISVVVLTKNNEDIIKGCLESIKWADEIIVVDNNSTDKTAEIAQKYTDKIYKSGEENFSMNRELGMSKAKGDWVFYMDSDERVLKDLREEIQTLIEKTNKSAFAISRRNIIFGKEVKYSAFWPDWVIRLIKKSDFIKWVGEVHEYATFKGDLGYTKNSLLHLTHRSVDNIVLKSLDYSKIDARLRLKASHPEMSSWRFLRILITETFNQGIKRRGFFNGAVGTMDSLLQTFSMVITYIRLWELQQLQSREDIYKSIDEKLIKDDFSF